MARKNWTTKTLLRRLGERLEELDYVDEGFGGDAIRKPADFAALTGNTVADLIEDLRNLALKEAGL